MASADLDDIFSLIESSEKLVEAKKRELADVVQRKSLCNENLRKIRQENGEKASKVESLQKELVMLKSNGNYLDIQLQVFNEQINAMNTSLETSRRNFALTESAVVDEKSEFSMSVESFLSKYDIPGEGIRIRRKELKERSVQMQAEKSKLIKEIDQLEAACEKIHYLKELQAKYEFKIKETKRLEAIRDELMKFPDNDPDFKRLANNLKVLREKDVKGLCENLAKDLESLELQHSLYCPLLGD